jgi:hypothetical protein
VDRFTSMLLNVLGKLVGPKALDIKVENMDSYNFKPKGMLTEVGTSRYKPLHWYAASAF